MKESRGENPSIHIQQKRYDLEALSRRMGLDLPANSNSYKPESKCEPTGYPPGSRQKVCVLAARVAANQGLWNPQDAPAGGFDCEDN